MLVPVLWLGPTTHLFAQPLSSVGIHRLVDISIPKQARVDLQWSAVDFRRGDSDPAFYQMRADVPRVEYRLDVARFLGRNARVYYVLPNDPGILAPQGLTVRWTAQSGVMRSGQARAGERTSVFDGRIDRPLIDEVFDLNLIVDSRFFTGRLNLNPYFEIEIY